MLTRVKSAMKRGWALALFATTAQLTAIRMLTAVGGEMVWGRVPDRARVLPKGCQASRSLSRSTITPWARSRLSSGPRM